MPSVSARSQAARSRCGEALHRSRRGSGERPNGPGYGGVVDQGSLIGAPAFDVPVEDLLALLRPIAAAPRPRTPPAPPASAGNSRRTGAAWSAGPHVYGEGVETPTITAHFPRSERCS